LFTTAIVMVAAAAGKAAMAIDMRAPAAIARRVDAKA
jgi:hypothetical protein